MSEYLNKMNIDGTEYEMHDTDAREAIATVEASSTASADHTPGTSSEYFILNGTLYRATVAIAAGDTFTPGTNCQTVHGGLGNEVSELKSAVGDLDATVNGATTKNYTENKNFSGSSASYTIVDDPYACISDYIPVTWGISNTDANIKWTYTDEAEPANNYYILYYDSSKNCIGSRTKNSSGGNRNVPTLTDSAYIRFSFKKGFAGSVANLSDLSTVYYTAQASGGNGLVQKVGDLTQLQTTAKASLVSAVNELKNDVDGLADDVSGIQSDIAPLVGTSTTYAYTAVSGYQNVPCTLAAGTYKCTNSGAVATFRDAENNQISELSISTTTGDNYVTLTVSAEKAAQIAFIRLYQGEVVISAGDGIIDRVSALETEIQQKADAATVNAALNGKADAVKEYIPMEITIEDYFISTNGTLYTSGQHFQVGSTENPINAAVRYKVSGRHLNSGYPFICQRSANGDVIASYEGDAGNITDYVFTPDSQCAYFYVNCYNNGACVVEEIVSLETYMDGVLDEANDYTDEKSAYTTYDLRQDREARYNLDQRNPFAWKPFDKAYFSWMNDDGLTDMYLFKDLCDSYNIPYANAVPWNTIKNNTVTVDGTPIVTYCKQIISDGGEIFVHGGTPLTSASTEADVMELFRNGKKYMEDALESPIYGIIEVGGSGYSTFDKTTGQKFCLAYYQYSDDYGNTPQYTLARTRIRRSSYDSDEAQIAAFKAVVDDAIANHKWVRFYAHGAITQDTPNGEISISVLTSVFDYIAAKVANGDCAWTGWKAMYDTFRSSALETRIKALET